MYQYNNTTVKRGDILTARSGEHAGENYLLVRVASNERTSGFGNELQYPTTDYLFNLVNTNTGKARITELDRLFETTRDGINNPIPLRDLEKHFKMTFQKATDVRAIASDVNKAVDARRPKPQVTSDANAIISGLAGLLIGVLAGKELAFAMNA